MKTIIDKIIIENPDKDLIFLSSNNYKVFRDELLAIANIINTTIGNKLTYEGVEVQVNPYAEDNSFILVNTKKWEEEFRRSWGFQPFRIIEES